MATDFRSLFDIAPNPYAILAPDLTVVDVNRAYSRVVLMDRQAMIGRNLFEIFPEQRGELGSRGAIKLRNSLERVLRVKQPDPMPPQRYDIPAPGGRGMLELYWSMFNVPALDEDGNVAWIVHRVEDVTDIMIDRADPSAREEFVRLQQETINRLREANDALARQVHWNNMLQADVAARTAALKEEVAERARTETELKDTKIFLDAVIENVPGMLFVKRADDLKWVLFNRAAEELLGYKRSELIGKGDHDFYPKDQADHFVAKDRETLAAGKTVVIAEEPIETPHNGTRILKTIKVPVMGKDGTPQFLLGFSEDITDRRAVEQQLRQAVKMEAVGQLTGGVAHDFNNILGVVIGNLDILMDHAQRDPGARELASEALNGALKGAELTRRLLAFSRRQPLQAVATDINGSLPQIAGMLRRTLEEHITVELHPGENLALAEVDPAQLDEAILNLAINARDAMPRGGILSIETANAELDEDYAAHNTEVKPGHYVLIAVSDTGTGMSKEIAEHAFEPFFTTKPEGKGTGLGLSMVYGFVKQSGGHIKIYSEIGHGTTIKVYLPRAAASVGYTVAAKEAAAPVGGHETILVVEDNEDLRLVTLKQLADLGYCTLEADSGPQALEVLKDHPEVDLLFTDIVMPGGMTGTELAREARALHPHLKIMLTSGYTARAMANGFHDIEGLELLNKPFRRAELAERLRRLLESAASARP